MAQPRTFLGAMKLRHVARLPGGFFSAEETEEDLGDHRNISLGVDERDAVRIAGELRIGPDMNDGNSRVCQPCQMLWIVDSGQDDVDPEVAEHPQRGIDISGGKSAEAMSAKHGLKSGKIPWTDQEDGTNRRH